MSGGLKSGLVLALIALLLPSPTIAGSLLLTGETLRSGSLSGLYTIPDGKIFLASTLLASMIGRPFGNDDVVELDTGTGAYRVHFDTKPFDVLISDLRFVPLDLTLQVAVHTPALPQFLIGYGRSDINAVGSVVYAGPLNPSLHRFIGMDLAQFDFDEDGLTDVVERGLGYDPTMVDSDGDDTEDGYEDLDNDGLINLDEVFLGTLLDDPDSDGDDIVDSIDDDPTNPSNICLGVGVDPFQFYTVAAGNTLTCASGDPIGVESTIQIDPTGHLILMTPNTTLLPEFGVGPGAALTIISHDPGTPYP